MPRGGLGVSGYVLRAMTFGYRYRQGRWVLRLKRQRENNVVTEVKNVEQTKWVGKRGNGERELFGGNARTV
jgi:hypothetical protein